MLRLEDASWWVISWEASYQHLQSPRQFSGDASWLAFVSPAAFVGYVRVAQSSRWVISQKSSPGVGSGVVPSRLRCNFFPSGVSFSKKKRQRCTTARRLLTPNYPSPQTHADRVNQRGTEWPRTPHPSATKTRPFGNAGLWLVKGGQQSTLALVHWFSK